MPFSAKFASYRVYEETSSGSLRIVEFVSRRSGNRMVREKAAVEGVDRDGSTPCFVLSKPVVRTNAPVGLRHGGAVLDPSVEESSTAFTEPEVMALAGTKFKHGRSLTARMSEEHRKNRRDRRGNKLPEVDLVERATNKKKAWEELGSALRELVREADVIEQSDFSMVGV